MPRLTPELLPSAASLLADAFFDNPAHVTICPDRRTRRRRLEALLGANLRAQPDLDHSFCLAEGSRVDAMGFWTRAGAEGPSPARLLRAGALGLPFSVGVRGLRAAVEVRAEIDRDLARALGGDDYWYLNNMAVRETLRGTGVGTRLLQEQLRSAADWPGGRRLALSTQRERNVIFYRRLGFEVVAERSVGEGELAFRNWTMLAESPG